MAKIYAGQMNQTADLIIFSNAIYDGVNSQILSGGVAVSGNRIMAIGSLNKIERLISRDTKVYRFGNKLLLPGFHDHHVHVFCGSLSQKSADLHDANSEMDAALKVKAYVDSHHETEWIFGFGWYHIFWKEKKLPHRNSLDKLISDRPVFLMNAELHGAWVNSKALELCNITKNTPDPPFGEIARDHRGHPTGFLYETAMGLIVEKAFQLNDKSLIDLFKSFLKKAASFGVTSVGDMMPLPGMELGNPKIYRRFENNGELTARIFLVGKLDEDLTTAMKLRDTYTSDKLRFSALKNFLDGVATTYTALLVEPYTDNKQTRGITLIPVDVIRDWVVNADKHGFRIRLHACGDGAVRLGLDCFAAAQKINGKRDARHSLEHIENIHPDDANRFGTLNITASVQPEHLAMTGSYKDTPYRHRLGQEREVYTWPNKTLLQSGATLALGSDYPVVDLNPMLEIYRAITRVHDDGTPEGGWTPKEKLTLAESLSAYTLGSAYASFMENDLGTLETGKLADIAVLDRNLFDVSFDQIRETKVILTVMDGRVVYEG